MKNLKSIITNSCSIVLGALVYAFLSLPVFTCTYGLSTYLADTTSTSTGYDIIKNLFDGGSSNFAGSLMAISMFVLSVVAGLMILVSLFNLLTEIGLLNIKSKKLLKAMKVTNFVLAAILAVFAIVGISCTASYVASGLEASVASQISEAFGGLLSDETIKTLLSLEASMSYGIILNTIVCILALVPTALEVLPCKKRK